MWITANVNQPHLHSAWHYAFSNLQLGFCSVWLLPAFAICIQNQLWITLPAQAFCQAAAFGLLSLINCRTGKLSSLWSFACLELKCVGIDTVIHAKWADGALNHYCWIKGGGGGKKQQSSDNLCDIGTQHSSSISCVGRPWLWAEIPNSTFRLGGSVLAIAFSFFFLMLQQGRNSENKFCIKKANGNNWDAPLRILFWTYCQCQDPLAEVTILPFLRVNAQSRSDEEKV